MSVLMPMYKIRLPNALTLHWIVSRTALHCKWWDCRCRFRAKTFKDSLLCIKCFLNQWIWAIFDEKQGHLTEAHFFFLFKSKFLHHIIWFILYDKQNDRSFMQNKYIHQFNKLNCVSSSLFFWRMNVMSSKSIWLKWTAAKVLLWIRYIVYFNQIDLELKWFVRSAPAIVL